MARTKKSRAAKRPERKHYAPPPQGDIGPDTPAQRAGAVVLHFKEANGAEFQRKRRDHALEIMAASRHRNGKPRTPEISMRQKEAGLRLHEAFCKTELSAESAFSRVYVDSTPRPDETTIKQIERITAFARLSKHIPRDCEGPVWHVAIKGRLLRDGYSRDGHDASMHKAQLQVALDILANELGF